jgi:hypothetical protein
MFKQLLMLNPLFEGEDTGGGGNIELSAEDILNKLNESNDDDSENKDDDALVLDNKESKKSSSKEKEDEDETKEGEDKESEEDDPLKELEEELKEPSEEDLELKTPVSRRQLMKEYPDIFKKHPGLESTIYRERAYTDILPTIEDAKNAKEALNILDNFDKDLKQGKTVDMMKAVLSTDEDAFKKLVDNYMPNLEQVNKDAYHHVLGNEIKHVVHAMSTYAKENDNKEVAQAAATLYQFMFNSTKWEAPKKLFSDTVVDDSVTKERERLNKEKEEFENQKQSEHITKLMGSIDNQVKGTIEKSIDPKDEMSEFTKNSAINEVLKKAGEVLKGDKRFQDIVKSLTNKSRSEKFNNESLNRIRSAYYTKYKSVLLPIIQSVRKEALKGKNARVKEEKTENDTTKRANRDTTVRDSKGGNNQNDKNKPKPGQDYANFLLR